MGPDPSNVRPVSNSDRAIYSPDFLGAIVPIALSLALGSFSSALQRSLSPGRCIGRSPFGLRTTCPRISRALHLEPRCFPNRRSLPPELSQGLAEVEQRQCEKDGATNGSEPVVARCSSACRELGVACDWSAFGTLFVCARSTSTARHLHQHYHHQHHPSKQAEFFKRLLLGAISEAPGIHRTASKIRHGHLARTRCGPTPPGGPTVSAWHAVRAVFNNIYGQKIFKGVFSSAWETHGWTASCCSEQDQTRLLSFGLSWPWPRPRARPRSPAHCSSYLDRARGPGWISSRGERPK
jgi:hypothetical protein